jgi:tetratricopeptide (TPR) repeat protein
MAIRPIQDRTDVVERDALAAAAVPQGAVSYVETLLHVAIGASESGRITEAAALLSLLIGRCGGREADALALLGQVSRRAGDGSAAAWLLRQALVIQPAHAWAHAELGETLRLAGQPGEAIVHLEKALALDPSLTAAPGSLAAAYASLDQHADALRWARKALDRNEARPEAHGLMGDVLARQGRATEAIAEYDKAIVLRKRESRAIYGRGLVRLGLGDMPGGWTDHEARLDLMDTGEFTQPLWRGQKRIKRRTILLHAEQGYGDTIQFIRYAALVAKMGPKVVVRVQRGLGRLCATVPGVDAAVEEGQGPPDFDLHCPLMSLPAVFATTLKSIPAAVPYLTANEFVRAEWRHALKPWRKMRVGIAWHGAPMAPAASVPLALLGPLLAREDIECHMIQRVTAPGDQSVVGDAKGLSDHSLALSDAGQTAALIAEMDLIIAADTVEAHLAGALGVPTWMMLQRFANWRWLRDREDSPWYPSIRLFRQAHPGDWHSVIEQVVHNLDAWTVQRS